MFGVDWWLGYFMGWVLLIVLFIGDAFVVCLRGVDLLLVCFAY